MRILISNGVYLVLDFWAVLKSGLPSGAKHF